MERIQGINPDRVQWCCDDRGITADDLADATGIPEANIERLMAGKDALTFNQLRDLARYFNRGVLFFLEAGPVNQSQIHTPQFRTITNQQPNLDPQVKALIERVEKQRAVYLGLREDLGDAQPSAFDPPALPEDDPKKSAAIVRDWLKVGTQNDFESYRKAVETQGILVFRTNGYHGAWQIDKENPVIGFSLFDERCPAIVVKKHDYEPRQTFTLLHECGHLLLHRSSFIDQNDDLSSREGNERAANVFAGNLLVPDDFLSSIDDGQRPSSADRYDTWLSSYRRTWGASTEVILRRLMDNGRLSDTEYGAYRRWTEQLPSTEGSGGSRVWRHREPKHIFGEPFVRTVFDALNARQITLAKASTYLDNLKIEDVHKLEKHLASV